MVYRLTDGDPDLDSVRAITAVLFTSDGACMAERDAPTLSNGVVRPGERTLPDAMLRIPLETHGFRMQRVHSVAVDDLPDGAGVRWYCFVEGSPYDGDRAHAEVELRRFTPEELARALEDRGSTEAAQVVRAAARAYREQDEASYLSDKVRLLEPAYLRAETPQGQSGIDGTDEEWRRSRKPVADALDRDGEFLDIGCANGYLMECVRRWAGERDLAIEPYGMDVSDRLAALARARLPQWADRIWLGNASTWVPPGGRRFDFVHTRPDVAPVGAQAALLRHLIDNALRPGGRLIVTHRDVGAGVDAVGALERLGYAVAGHAGEVAWTDPGPTAGHA